MSFALVVGLPFEGRAGTLRQPDRLEWDGGTVGQLADLFPYPVGVYFGGRELSRDEQAPDGCVAITGVGDVLYIGLQLLIAAGMTWASTALAKKAALAALRDTSPKDEGGSANFVGSQSTRFGPNFAVPIVCGRFGVRGHVIAQRIEPVETGVLAPGENEVERTVVAVSEGPIRRIGGMTGGAIGETERMGSATALVPTNEPFPAGVYKNGVLLTANGSEIALRMGRSDQSRLSGWPGQSSLQVVGAPLNNEGEEVFITIDEALADQAFIAIDFPGGLYRQTRNDRLDATVRISVQSRQLNGTAWTQHPELVLTASRARTFADYRTLNLQPAQAGPYLIWLRRLTPAGDPGEYVTACTIRTVEVRTANPQTYAGTALAEIGTLGSTSSSSGDAQYLIPTDGILVRSWLPGVGWSAHGWDAVSPWVYPIGRNPAWIAVELLTNRDYGLGNKLIMALGGAGDEELSLDDFARWAVNCDQAHQVVADRARHEFNFSIDTRRPEMEWLLAIFAAGHAIPLIDGGLLTVSYEYRDAHSRGPVSVPARQPYQTLCTANCESLEIRFRDPGSAASKVTVSFFDEAQGYALQPIEQNDYERQAVVDGIPPRVIAEEVEAPGITHREMARQEAWYRLQWVKGGLVEATMRGGLALATITVGDTFWLQHDCWSPVYDDDRTGSMRAVTDSPTVPVSSVVFDRAITNGTARTDRALFITSPEGLAQLVTIDGTGTYAAGTPVPLWSPANSAPAQVLVARDATVAHGRFGAFERPMKVVGMSVSPTYEVEITAVAWPSSAFDEAPESLLTDDGALAASPLAGADVMPIVRPRSPDAIVQPTATVTMSSSGAPLVAWSQPVTPDMQRATGPARVFVRPAGGAWERIAEASGSAVLADLPPGWHDVAVVLPVDAGGYAHPATVAPSRVYRPELWGQRPAAPGNLQATATGERAARLTWSPARDAVRYEVRRGISWLDAPLVGETSATELLLLELEPGEHRLMVAGLGAGGLIGDPSSVTHTVAHPIASLATASDTTAPALGDDELDHTYTTAELDTGLAAASYLWSAIVEGHAEDATMVGDLTALVGELEGMVAGMPATSLRPGITADETVGAMDPAATIDGLSGSVWGASKPTGSRVTFATEVRVYNGSWGSWQAYRGPIRAMGSRMQTRVTRQRQGRGWSATIPRIQQTVSA